MTIFINYFRIVLYNSNKILFFLIPLFLSGYLNTTYATSKYAHSNINWTTGPWYNAATGGGIVSSPVSGDNVFTNGFSVTVDASSTCDNLTLTNLLNAIVVNSPNTLTVRGTLNCATNPTNDIVGGNGTIILTGAFNTLVIGSNWNENAAFFNVTFDPGVGVGITTSTGNILSNGGTITFATGTTSTGNNADIRGQTGATLTINSGAKVILNGGQIRATNTGNSFFPNVNINGTLTATSYVNVTNLTIGTTGLFQTAYSAGTQGWFNAGFAPTTLVLNGTVEYNFAGAQVIYNKTYNNLKISNSGTKTLIGNTTVNGTLTIGGTATLSASTFALSYGPSGVLYYFGSVPQTTTNAEFPVTNGPSTLTVNNSSGITLHANRSVSTLNMTLGNITTGANILTLGTSTANLGTLNYTVGKIITGNSGGFARWFAASAVSNVFFPVGTLTTQNDITLSFTSPPSTGGTLTGMFSSTDPGNNNVDTLDDNGYAVDSYSSAGYWQINTGNGMSNDGLYDLKLRGQGFNPTGQEITNYPNLRILKRADALSLWFLDGTHASATGSNNDPTLNRTGLTGFSQFAMGGNMFDGNPLSGTLPVEMYSFYTTVQERNITLSWITLKELNNTGFEVQRQNFGTSNAEFYKIGFVQGAGSSNNSSTYNFSDKNLSIGKYKYRLKQIDVNGNYKYFELGSIIEIGIPAKFNLSQNYPNPFNPVTKINYELPFDSKVNLIIFDALGRKVKSLVNEEFDKAGYYSIQLNATQLSSGIYYYRLTAGGINGKSFTATKKMVLIK